MVHKKFNFQRKNIAVSLLWIFVYCSVHFYGKALNIVTKYSNLDVVGVLNLPQCA